MAEFPPNLDDGELWLPSDIFMNDVAANRYIRLTPRRYSSLDGLCRGFSALSLLPPRLYVGYSPPALGLSHKYFQRYLQPTQYGTAISPPAVACFGTSLTRLSAVHHVCDHRNTRSALAPKLLYDECRLLQPARIPQVEGCVETRARLLPERVKNQLGTSCQGRGVSRRDCGGTGVFLPRVAEYATSVTDFRRKQGARNRSDVQISQQLNSFTRGNPVIQQDEECHGQLPPEMVLPHDWTY